ncbi:MAG: glycosyltransferase family 2 protein [Gemmatimonadaceae bacterium]|nr:glycosyltransferase family 2 protein [Gemmatimonadaceae bacterium]
MSSPRFSICIPTFNRSSELRQLFDSILGQRFTNYEVICCDDFTPEPARAQKREMAQAYERLFDGRLRYVENPRNLGYDRNLRTAMDYAAGEYIVLMGDDDLLAPGALEHFDAVLTANSNPRFLLRSYATFRDDPSVQEQIHRYYPRETRFQPGAETIKRLFHRAVLVSGLVIHRASAVENRTDKVDGTLYYQLYVIAMILSRLPAVATPQITVYNRLIGPEKSVFGNSQSEKGFWEPGKRTIASSLYQMKQYLKVAKIVEDDSGLDVYRGIRNELSKYSYSFLSYHSDKGARAFIAYARDLIRAGFGREPFFYVYVTGLLTLGPGRCYWIINQIKRRLGHTPRL